MGQIQLMTFSTFTNNDMLYDNQVCIRTSSDGSADGSSDGSSDGPSDHCISRNHLFYVQFYHSRR